MKKLLVIGAVVVSSISFAKSDNVNMLGHGRGHHTGHKMMGCGGMRDSMTPEMRDEMIEIQEKRLQIMKIMNTSNPNMKEVEKLNNEIYQIKSNHMTEMMKRMNENKNN